MAVVCAIPIGDPGLTFIYGRQSCDTQSMEDGDIDVGNAQYGGQEAMIIIEDSIRASGDLHGQRIRIRLRRSNDSRPITAGPMSAKPALAT